MMSTFFERFFEPSHEDVVKAVTEALGESGWYVEVEPVVGNVRPDIVAREPSGNSYVIEIKQGKLEANLGAVAQVERFRNMVATDRGGEVKGMLVVAGEPPEDLRAIAHSADVALISAESSNPSDVVDSLRGAGLLQRAIA